MQKGLLLRLPGVEPGSIAWKAIILTLGLQTLLTADIPVKYYNPYLIIDRILIITFSIREGIKEGTSDGLKVATTLPYMSRTCLCIV